MSKDIQLGLYGKLPGYGDFVHRNLPNHFLTAWDEWLQGYIAGSREKMGAAWLDIYLTSPLWRFVLSAGVIDDRHWAGLVLPSVDQVGRYYPFSVVIPLPANTNPLEFMAENSEWYEHIESLALRALDAQISLEEMLEQSEHEQYLTPLIYNKTGLPGQVATLKVDFHSPEVPISQGYAHLLDSILSSQHQSYSVWSTSGSEKIQPCLFTVAGLPTVSQLPAMLDGHWSHWGWPQTAMINQEMLNASLAKKAVTHQSDPENGFFANTVTDNSAIEQISSNQFDASDADSEIAFTDNLMNADNIEDADAFNESLLNDPLFNPSIIAQTANNEIFANESTQLNRLDDQVDNDAFNDSLLNDPLFNPSAITPINASVAPENQDILVENIPTERSIDNEMTQVPQKKNIGSGSVLDELNIMDTGNKHHE